MQYSCVLDIMECGIVVWISTWWAVVISQSSRVIQRNSYFISFWCADHYDSRQIRKSIFPCDSWNLLSFHKLNYSQTGIRFKNYGVWSLVENCYFAVYVTPKWRGDIDVVHQEKSSLGNLKFQFDVAALRLPRIPSHYSNGDK